MERNYLFIDQSLEQLKQSIQKEKKPLFKRLYEVCRLYKEQSLPEEHPDKSTTFMGMAAFNLSLSYVLTKQEHYLEEAKRWIFTAVNYPHWGNKFLVDVDLSAAWMLFGLSVAYDWLKEDLTPKEREKLREKILLQGSRMYDFKIKTEGKGWSTAYWQNHNWINLTGLATAGYALSEEVEEVREWTACAKTNFAKVFEYMAEDGSDYEGVVYWRYGVIWLYIYAHLLKGQEGKDYFKESSFLKETFYYRLYQAMPNLEEIANFGDCHDKRSSHSIALYYKVAAEYGNGHAQYLGNKVRKEFLFREQYESKVKPGILPEAGLELLWYNEQVEEENFEALPLVKHFEDLGLVVVRSSWKEDAIHFSFKCGAPGGKKQWEKSWELFEKEGIETRGLSHQHPDNNSFILHGFDTYHAIDEGYNRTVKAIEHNVVTVDGKGYPNENQNNIWHQTAKESVAEIVDCISNQGITYFAGDAYKMYEPELQLTKCIRHVIYTGRKHFYIIDELDSMTPHTYTFNLHTETPARTTEQGCLVYENGPGKMYLYTKVGKNQTLVQKTGKTYVKAIMTSQEPDIYREVNMDTLRLENETPSKEMLFFNILSLREAFEDETIKVREITLESSEGYELSSEGQIETLLFSSKGHICYEQLEAQAKLVHLTKDEEGNQRILAVGCKKLCVGNQQYYEGDAKTIVVEVNR